ncbi:MAG: transcriptional regulator, LysR family [Lachnospiraceae bacterium]|jgi:DNA-binding transcriptional LysR family regulator|nr:transcriptional regulator, LysR family [Lachnospiraceae bacterium]
MTLKQLEYFLAIAQTSNMTLAAKNLNVSQPPLSYQIKLLEDELGLELFIRSGRSLKITNEGLLLQEKANQILSLVNNTTHQVKNLRDNVRGTIHIGTVTSVCSRVLPERVLQFSSHFPGANFEILEDSSPRIMELLNNGIVDIGIVREPFPLADYEYQILNDPILNDKDSDYFVAMAKSEYFDGVDSDEISVINLKNKPLLIHKRFYDILENACQENGFSMKVSCQIDNIMSLIRWAEAGIGVAIAPFTSSTLVTNPSLSIKKITHPTIQSRAYLIWNKSNSLSYLSRQFIKLFD